MMCVFDTLKRVRIPWDYSWEGNTGEAEMGGDIGSEMTWKADQLTTEERQSFASRSRREDYALPRKMQWVVRQAMTGS